MSRIPFLLIRTFNPEDTTACLEDRFYRHLCKLRGVVPPSQEDDEMTSFLNPQIQGPFAIREEDRYRIRKRARRIFDARKAASGLDRLKTDDRARLEKLHDGVRLVPVSALSGRGLDGLARRVDVHRHRRATGRFGAGDMARPENP